MTSLYLYSVRPLRLGGDPQVMAVGSVCTKRCVQGTPECRGSATGEVIGCGCVDRGGKMLVLGETGEGGEGDLLCVSVVLQLHVTCMIR